MRITNKVFTDLAIWMIGFGIFIGVVFPFFILLFGIDRSIVFSRYFISVCISAGVAVGGLNFSHIKTHCWKKNKTSYYEYESCRRKSPAGSKW